MDPDPTSYCLEVIEISDFVVAASLMANGHVPRATNSNLATKELSVIFRITRKLRRDLRRYANDELMVNARELNFTILDLTALLDENEQYIKEKLRLETK